MRTAIISFVHQFSKIKMISKEIGLAYSGKLDFSSKNLETILFQQKNVAPSRISLMFLKFLTFLDQIYHEKSILIKLDLLKDWKGGRVVRVLGIEYE